MSTQRLIFGDCRALLRELPDASIEACVTDPPSAVAFMEMEWDRFGPRGEFGPFQDFIAEVFTEVFRVLKPGAHALVWALPRTSHHTAMGVERAGFEIRDVISHLQSQGMPKSLDVGKAIDRQLGAERTEVVGVKAGHEDFVDRTDAHAAGGRSDGWDRPWRDDPGAVARSHQRMAPATPEAEVWDGHGTGLKPMVEHWILARKPIPSTVATNVLVHGTGGLNIEGCRIGYRGIEDEASARPAGKATSNNYAGAEPDAGRELEREEFEPDAASGRWPANCVASHAEGCIMTEQWVEAPARDESRPPPGLFDEPMPGTVAIGRDEFPRDRAGIRVEEWACVRGCAVRALDDQAGTRTSGAAAPGGHRRNERTQGGIYGRGRGLWEGAGPAGHLYDDSGPASRFIFVAKPGRGERNAGLDSSFEEKPLNWSSGTKNPGSFQSPGTKKKARNHHPTVKSVELMRWLVRLVSPPGENVTMLDPFMGSGTTGIAAVHEGVSFVGMEAKEDYFAIAQARIAHAVASCPPRLL